MESANSLEDIVANVHRDMESQLGRGKVADYIPALARVDPKNFAIAVATCDGRTAGAGGVHLPFSIQSISKIFTLTLALNKLGANLWERVGREPSGSRFNSIVQLEAESYAIAGQPFNLASPKQLGEIFFDKLGLPVIKKTATGARSTDEEVLEKLAEDYPLPAKI